jgi:hypothetical protein
MRSTSLLFMLLCGLAFSGWAQAQTWKSPLVFDTSPYVSVVNSCNQWWQTLIIADTGDDIYGPVVVYRVLHSAPASRLNRPWSVQLLPQFGFLDFSIWVCANHFGNVLSECWDGSDNGAGMVNNVSVPGFYSTSWYVVVAGNIFGEPQNCGAFTLVATKQ